MPELNLLTDQYTFPDPERALEEPNGLLCIGGDLSVQRLVEAYRKGIFPWFNEDQPILWWSPDPRCIYDLKSCPMTRRTRRLLKNTHLNITFDRVFDDVIQQCAAPRPYSDETWITEDMLYAYKQLHRKGIAHSIEVWDNDHHLIGGLYGIAIGRCFFGESMFSRQSNGSKIAFYTLALHLAHWGYQLFDCQVPNPHLMNLGAESVPREHFLTILQSSIDQKTDHSWKRERLWNTDKDG